MSNTDLNVSDWLDAVENGKFDYVTDYISRGGNINAVNEFGVGALCLAAFHGHNEIVKFLILQGADVNIKSYSNTSYFTSALNIAASFGNVEILKLLIEAGATYCQNLTQLYSYDRIMETPMGQAAYYLKKDVVIFLLEKGNKIGLDQLKVLFKSSINREHPDFIDMREFIQTHQSAIEQRDMLNNIIDKKVDSSIVGVASMMDKIKI